MEKKNHFTRPGHSVDEIHNNVDKNVKAEAMRVNHVLFKFSIKHHSNLRACKVLLCFNRLIWLQLLITKSNIYVMKLYSRSQKFEFNQLMQKGKDHIKSHQLHMVSSESID